MKSDTKISGGFSNILFLGFGRGLQIAIQIASIRLLTSLLSPTEVGRFYALASVQGWVGLSFVSAPGTYLNRNYLEWKKQNLHGPALKVFILYALFLAIVTAGIAWLLLRSEVISSSGLWVLSACVLGAWMFGTNVMAQAVSLVNLLGRTRTFVSLRLVAMILGFALASFFVLAMDRSAEKWIWGLGLGHIVIGIVTVWVLLQHSGLSPRRWFKNQGIFHFIGDHRSTGFSFMGPIMLMTGIYWLQSQGYRIPVAAVLGESQLGLFSVSYSMGANVIIAAEAIIINQWLVPMYYRRIVGVNSGASDSVWRESVAGVLPVLVLVAVFSVVAGPFMLRLLAHDEFQGAASLALWGGIAESTRLFAGLFYIGGVGRQDTRRMILPHIPGGIFMLVAAGSVGIFYSSLHVLGLNIFLSYLVLVVSLWVYVDRSMMTQVSGKGLRFPLVVIILMLLIFAVAWMNEWYRHIIPSAIVVMALGASCFMGVLPFLLNFRTNRRLE